MDEHWLELTRPSCLPLDPLTKDDSAKPTTLSSVDTMASTPMSASSPITMQVGPICAESSCIYCISKKSWPYRIVSRYIQNFRTYSMYYYTYKDIICQKIWCRWVCSVYCTSLSSINKVHRHWETWKYLSLIDALMSIWLLEWTCSCILTIYWRWKTQKSSYSI